MRQLLYIFLTSLCNLNAAAALLNNNHVLKQVVDDNEADDNDHNIPTLLSILETSTGNEKEKIKFSKSTSNKLYERLFEIRKNSISHYHSTRRSVMQRKKDSIEIKLSKYNVTHSHNINSKLRVSLDLSNNAAIDEEDIVTLYCPADEANVHNFRDAVTIEQLTKHHSSSIQNDILHWELNFPIIRQESCQFRLYSYDFQQYKSNSRTLLIHEANTAPHGIHLSFQQVHFTTGTAKNLKPTLRLRRKDQQEFSDIIYGGTTTTYTSEDLCDEPANQEEPGKFSDPGLLHTISLPKNLEEDTEYEYQVGTVSINSQSEEIFVWSDSYSFKTPPNKLSQFQPIEFLVYGDQGCPLEGWEYGMQKLAKVAEIEKDAKFIQHVGDLSYANGAGHIWDAWLQMIQPLATSMPYMITLGNHELSTPAHDGGECGVPTYKRFSYKTNGNGIYWYSFDYLNSVHLISISSEHDISKGSEQFKWLQQDLKRHKHKQWIVVTCHRPMYSPQSKKLADHHVRSTHELRDNLEELLLQHNVDLFVAGHHHKYIRTCALQDGGCNENGIVHVTIGTAGANIGKKEQYVEDWVESAVFEYGYGKVSLYEKGLKWEFKSDERSHRVLDHFWIPKRNKNEKSS